MQYLLDTHAFLWFCSGSKKLSENAKNIIENADNKLLISIASIWEIAIKNSLGKLDIDGGFRTVEADIERNEIEIVPIDFSDTVIQNTLDFHHRDPFDRMIISQSINKQVDIISIDAIFDEYYKETSNKRIWD